LHYANIIFVVRTSWASWKRRYLLSSHRPFFKHPNIAITNCS